MFPSFVLLAQSNSLTNFLYFAAVVAVTLIVPFVVGRFLASRLRMDTYGWKIGLILASVFMAIFIVGRTWKTDAEGNPYLDLKLGVDLKGGVILVYEVDESAPLPGEEDEAGGGGQSPFSMSALVEALSRRINPSGTKEIVIRPVGDDRQVEIIIPEVDQNEVARIKKEITTAGVLQFRIVANSRDHQDVIELASTQAKAADSLVRRRQVVRDDNNESVGLWARVAREQGDADVRPFKLDVSSATLRNAGTGELLIIPAGIQGTDPDAAPARLAEFVASQGIQEIDVLMATNDGYNVTGGDLGMVQSGVDEILRPCIFFNLKGDGIDRFADLTDQFAPTANFYRRLGIMLDNELLSAPNINEMIQGRGQISGRFTEAEVTFLVNILQAGSLPVVLNKNPISENLIDPLLGEATVRQGKYAIAISISLVLVFILIYYRFSGAIACMALVANLLFILALMISIQAALTLPGLAGLVLTVGMSVDANVLIFERIREELKRGTALRMAIRNGYAKATTTIVDANVTTLITAIVLYWIGTDQIRGFSVTLILGIVMSMYTAIFCSRVIFDIAEKTWRMTELNMTQLLGATQFDFIGKRKIAAFVSITLICVGVAGIAARGADIFDIDFRGGTSVHMMFAEPVGTEEVREQLAAKFDPDNIRFTVTAMNNTGGAELNNTFKVDSSLTEVSDLQAAIQGIFSGGSTRLATYSLEHGELKTVQVEAPTADEETSQDSAVAPGGEEASEGETAEEETGEESESDDQSSAQSLPSDTLLAYAVDPSMLLAQADTVSDDEGADDTDNGEAADETESSTEMADDSPQATTRVEVDLSFGHAINAETLRGEIVAAASELDFPLEESDFELVNPNWDGMSSNAFGEWNLKIPVAEDQALALLENLEGKFASTPVWPSSNKIGGQVADRMQNRAIAALAASLMGIVIYIWIRFQRVIFGLAAVVALIHDVLLTLGAIAVSAWLAGALGFLLIEEFKISLPIVAALLTIIGYSLNDTIVVFDRIREVKGKSPDLTSDTINTSINQTLSRTLLTSLTTLIVVLILYAIGGQGIHGFAFSLVVGVIAGTYSSIFVASPVLLWMTGSSSAPKSKSAAA